MAWTIELFDQIKNTTFDITSRVLEFTTTKALNTGVNAFSISAINIEFYHKKNLITIKKNGVVKLKGIILNQYDSQQNTLKLTSFECVDNGFILGRTLVAEIYTAVDATGGLPSKIIKDIVTNYLAVSGFTSTNVDLSTTPIITNPDVLEFPYIYAQDAIDRVMEHLVDWNYYIDNNRDVHFFYKAEVYSPTAIEETKNDTSKSIIMINTLTVESIGDEEYNRVWIIGASRPADTAIDQFFTGDGSQRYFNLSYTPYELNMYVGGVLKTVAEESNDDGNKDFLVGSSDKVVYIPSYRSPYTGTIKANYKPEKQIIDKFENPSSISAVGAYEKIIKDSDITSRSSARKIGIAEIKRQSSTKRILRFDTRTELALGTGYYVDILLDGKNADGSVVTNVWNLQGNYLVREISSTITPEDEIYSVVMEEIK